MQGQILVSDAWQDKSVIASNVLKKEGSDVTK
jgi:hypothetical protein